MLHQNINDNLSWRLIPGDNHDVSHFPPRPTFSCMHARISPQSSLGLGDLFSQDDRGIICLIQQIWSYSNDRWNGFLASFRLKQEKPFSAVKPLRPSRVPSISRTYYSNLDKHLHSWIIAERAVWEITVVTECSEIWGNDSWGGGQGLLGLYVVGSVARHYAVSCFRIMNTLCYCFYLFLFSFTKSIVSWTPEGIGKARGGSVRARFMTCTKAVNLVFPKNHSDVLGERSQKGFKWSTENSISK